MSILCLYTLLCPERDAFYHHDRVTILHSGAFFQFPFRCTKHHNQPQFKMYMIDQVVLLSKCFSIGGSFWQKDSFITCILFELWLIMMFSPPERKLEKRTSVHCVSLTLMRFGCKCTLFSSQSKWIRVVTLDSHQLDLIQ